MVKREKIKSRRKWGFFSAEENLKRNEYRWPLLFNTVSNKLVKGQKRSREARNFTSLITVIQTRADLAYVSRNIE